MERMPLRIVFFDFVYQLAGKPRSTLELADRLRDRHEFVFLDPAGECESYVEAVRANDFPIHVLMPHISTTRIGFRHRPVRRAMSATRNLAGMVQLRARLGAALERVRPDALWTSSFKALAILRSVGWLRTVPTFLHFRQAWTDSTVRGWRGRLVSRDGVHIIALDKGTVGRAVAAGCHPSRVHRVPNAVDVDAVRSLAARPMVGRVPVRRTGARILLPGSITPRKGQACAVRAAAQLASQGLDVELLLAGAVSGEDGKRWAQQVSALACDVGIQDRVQWLGWREDMPQLIQSSDVVVLPSTDEGLPRVLLEAVALERPIVTTPVGGIPDLVEHGRTGWLHPPNDSAAMAEAVAEALKPDRSGPVTKTALEKVRNEFSGLTQARLAEAAFGAPWRLHGDRPR
jgi:glycosyltransferase involved in cell wall biosynthesis